MPLRPPGMKNKSTAEYTEITEFFLYKEKNKSFYGYGLLFIFRTSGDRDKRVNEEDAECAEIIP